MRLPLLAAFAACCFVLGSGDASAQGRWVPCAAEGGFCDVPYPTVVRYGARGAFADRRVGRGVPCTNEVFGDPLVGVGKQCFYLAQDASPSADAGWRRCADEDGYCAFRGAATVRYGARGRFSYRSAVNGVECSNEVFGDPLVGVRKHCEVQQQ